MKRQNFTNCQTLQMISISLILFLQGCVSIQSFPETADEVSFTPGMTSGLPSGFEAMGEFSNVSVEEVFQAASYALETTKFRIRKADPSKNALIGERGMTPRDWNILGGIYLKELNRSVKVKILVKASNTSPGHLALQLLNTMGSSLNQKPQASKNESNRIPKTSTGTGFFINDSGLLVTASHVVSASERITVKYRGVTHEAFVIANSRSTDLAVLKIEPDQPTDYLQLGTAKDCSLGDEVFTIGYPISKLLNSEAVYSEGSISSLSGLDGEPALLQTSTPIQPGNSGGPLVRSGKVVGVISSTAAVSNFYKLTGTLPQNINWVVKIDYLQPLLPTNVSLPTLVSVKNIIKETEKAICLVSAQ